MHESLGHGEEGLIDELLVILGGPFILFAWFPVLSKKEKEENLSRVLFCRIMSEVGKDHKEALQ